MIFDLVLHSGRKANAQLFAFTDIGKTHTWLLFISLIILCEFCQDQRHVYDFYCLGLPTVAERGRECF